jgi:phospholipid/cholesterol/gamma-HCH transport system ATP-binding protein
VRDVTVAFGDNVVLDRLSLDVYPGEILGFVGASGSGKSVLLRTVLGLTPKRAAQIELFGVDLDKADERERMELDMRVGVLFQHGALFSALTVKENVQVPMREYLDLPQKLMDELALLKIELVGLKADAADKFPSELSGGMIKRAALARALALDPDIVFLDEPTSGLDPIGAADFDELVAKLRDTLGLTVYMVTHDLDSLFSVCDRIAVLGGKKVLVQGTCRDDGSRRALGEILFPRQAGAPARSGGKTAGLRHGAWKPEPITSSSASSRWLQCSRPSASSTGRFGRRSRRHGRTADPHSRLGLGPEPRQRGAVQRRAGRRRAPRLYRRQRSRRGHRGGADRPAHAHHRLDPGRCRPRQPDRPGQHRDARLARRRGQSARYRRGAGRIAEVTANPSAVADLLESAQSIFRRADRFSTSSRASSATCAAR